MENKNIEKLTTQLLKEIGEDPSREGLLRTPKRVSKAWQFFAKGYNQDLEKIINNAIFNEDAKDMVIVRDIEFFSLCEHHLIPFLEERTLVIYQMAKLLDFLRFLGLLICFQEGCKFKKGLQGK